jgi:hypothetical protein
MIDPLWLYPASECPTKSAALAAMQAGRATARGTTGRLSISDKMWWRNLDLSLIPMLLVTKLIFITIVPTISDKLLYRHSMHLQWRI